MVPEANVVKRVPWLMVRLERLESVERAVYVTPVGLVPNAGEALTEIVF